MPEIRIEITRLLITPTEKTEITVNTAVSNVMSKADTKSTYNSLIELTSLTETAF